MRKPEGPVGDSSLITEGTETGTKCRIGRLRKI